jgi:hypothetical protein
VKAADLPDGAMYLGKPAFEGRGNGTGGWPKIVVDIRSAIRIVGEY